MTAIDKIKERVSELYKFRDEYFTTHSPDDATNKTKEVQEEINKTLKMIDGLKDQVSADKKGELYFLRGKALNATQDYSPEAEEELGRATRFNSSDAWNELGECQFKKGDLTGAQTCFEKALKLAQNKVYYRNMSMLMRSLPWNTASERENNVEKGLEYARKAINLDMNDGQSWLVLGNAYLTSFFSIDSKLESLKNCKAAYTKASSDPVAATLPELHFSKFHVQWYEEDYAGALNSLRKASELEPSWVECKAKFNECHKFLSKLTLMVKSKGQLNQRRINSLIADIHPSQLGPYEKGGTNLTAGKQPDLVPLSLLGEGNNKDKIILGKVVCTVIPESGIPFSMCVVDKEGDCIAVTVYNWARGCGVKIGDSVAVVAPVLKIHSVEVSKDEKLEFRAIRVALPLMLVVNKRAVGVSQVATSKIVSQQKPE
ncbi:tetratricopeptide repeat protein 5-like [Palaemon carinicauda]|uniref:tetratricopeptide repeat protein 5-like n=1 Tax=Palaemon carinicauda TaxID=392227 RepID=UPI0035B59E42